MAAVDSRTTLDYALVGDSQSPVKQLIAVMDAATINPDTAGAGLDANTHKILPIPLGHVVTGGTLTGLNIPTATSTYVWGLSDGTTTDPMSGTLATATNLVGDVFQLTHNVGAATATAPTLGYAAIGGTAMYLYATVAVATDIVGKWLIVLDLLDISDRV